MGTACSPGEFKERQRGDRRNLDGGAAQTERRRLNRPNSSSDHGSARAEGEVLAQETNK